MAHSMVFLRRAGLVIGLVILLGSTAVAPASRAEETTIKVPVVPRSIRQGLICTAETLQHIEIRVLGPLRQLETLPALKLTYDLNLADTDIGFHVLPARQDAVTLPPEVSIAGFDPSHIQVRLDVEIEKGLPVAIVCKGEPASGYTVVNTQASPDRVLLKGPKLVIDGMQAIATHPIDIGGASESFRREVPLVFPENVRMIPAAEPIVAQIHLAEQIITRTLDAIPVQGRNADHPFEISPALLTVRVKGPAKVVSDLADRGGLNVYIDLKDLQPGVFVRRATIELPVDTALLEVEPKIFTVTIKQK